MWKKEDKKRRLVNINLEEVSLVDMPANRKSFYMIKSQRRKAMSFLKMLEKIVGAPTVKEKSFAKSLKENSVEALTEAVESIGEYQDDMPSEVVKAVNVLVKAACYGSYVPVEDGEDENGVEKVGARLSKEVATVLKDIATYMKASIKVGKNQRSLTKTQITKLDELLGLAKGEVKSVDKKVDEDEDEDKDKEEDVDKTGITEEDVKKLMEETIKDIMSGKEDEE